MFGSMICCGGLYIARCRQFVKTSPARVPLLCAGILADEMGLGKTLQSISILAYMRDFQKVCTLRTPFGHIYIYFVYLVPVQEYHYSGRPGLFFVQSIFNIHDLLLLIADIYRHCCCCKQRGWCYSSSKKSLSVTARVRTWGWNSRRKTMVFPSVDG